MEAKADPGSVAPEAYTICGYLGKSKVKHITLDMKANI